MEKRGPFEFDRKMWMGLTTIDLFDQCVTSGLCTAHREELEVQDVYESQELQRKALLYIRLQVYGPILFGKPFCYDKMQVLFDTSDCFKLQKDTSGKDHDVFIDRILAFDSVALFVLCQFCKICCAGALFQSGPKACSGASNDILLKLLTSRAISEEDVRFFHPLLKGNFPGFDENLLRICYVAVLLYVRNITGEITLNQAANHLEKNMKNDSKEVEHWESIGADAFKRKSWEEAVNAFTQALSYRPYNLTLLVNRSHCLMKLLKLKDAVMDAYLAVLIDPNCIDAYSKLASLLYMLDDYQFCIRVADYCLFKCSGEEFPKLKMLEKLKKKLVEAEAALKEKTPASPNIYSKELEAGDLTRRNLEDLPKLIEASDSESDYEDVPDLMEASNSEESDLDVMWSNSNMNCHSVSSSIEHGTNSKEYKSISCESKIVVEDQMRMLQESLKEASQTLLDGYEVMAVRRFRDALEEIKASPEIHKYEECDIICVKYAYAFACYKSGGYDDIQKAITILKEITEEHKEIVFPAAYYCIGLAYLKMNRFKLALEYLQRVDEILQNEVQCKVCIWPGHVTVIDETSIEHLKNVLPDLIKECENPPQPNATCRFEKCTLQPSIYYTDPDFKGFYFIQCSEHCCLQYHVQCWKSIKTSANYTDKKFLEQKCYTPDCEGLIIKIQIINKEGNVGKEFSLENKKVTKQKKTKLEKKLEIKDEKKRKRKDSSSRTESTSEVPEDISITNPPESEIGNPHKEVKSHSRYDAKDTNSNGNPPNVSLLSVNAEPFIVLRKEKVVNETAIKVPTKIKEHKKSKSNTYSIDEFLQKSEASLYNRSNEHQQRLNSLQHTGQSLEEAVWSKNINNIYNPSTSTADDVQTMPSTSSFNGFLEVSETGKNTSLDLNSDLEFPKPSFNLKECIKEKMYSHFKEILGKYGPLRVNDLRLTKKLKNFPDEIQIIAASGGIGKFLQQNVEFALVRGTYVCLVDQLTAAYKKIDEAPLSIHNMDINLTNNFETSNSKDDKNSEIFRFSCLNPDAREYMPETSPENKTGMISDKEILEHNSPELAAISKLRKPLADDQKSVTSLYSSLQQGVSEADCKSYRSSTASTNYSLQNEVLTDSKVMDLVEKLKETIKIYFSEEVKEHQNYIDVCLQPFRIIQIPKKKDTSIQTENDEIEKVSRGTLQNDGELHRLKEITNNLIEEKNVLEKQYKSDLNSAAEYQKKSSNEITSLKRELGGAKIKLQEQADDFKSIKSNMEEKIKKLSELLKKVEADNITQVENIDKLQSNNESLKLDSTFMEERICTLLQEKLKLSHEIEAENKIKSDVKSLEFEKIQLEKRAQKAEYLLLESKKTEFRKRIEIKKTEAVNKINEVRNGIALISTNLNPIVVKNLETLVTQIRKYISTLDDILKEFVDCIDQQIIEVKKGVPLTNLKPLNVRELPELPNLSFEPMSNAMYQVPWHLMIANCNVANSNPYQFLSTSTTVPDSKPNQASNQPIPSVTKVPPGLSETKTVHVPAMAMHNMHSDDRQGINMASQKSTTQLYAATASSNLNPNIRKNSSSEVTADSDGKKTSDKRFNSSSSLELDYNIKKRDASFAAATTYASSSRSHTASPVSKKNLEKDVKKSFEKLISKLVEKFPNHAHSDIVTSVKEFRDKRKTGLSGLTLDNIIQSVSEIIEAKEKNAAANQVQELSARTKMMPNVVLVNKKLMFDEKMKAPPLAENTTKKSAWGITEVDSSKQWLGSVVDECAICCEEMTSRTAYKVDCNHYFHLRCIRKWLEKKSDCPICRVHLLLPEDYPALS
ncbi:e3 ubiquitin-protein ligase TTC3 [Nephila pilipes]|uniref:E3 ubiquitin-protein ligase TTC3 n=1 Tax=Nephila pilipes TaxID=299642 RepID=A0A8X6KNN9_NEPPI|nr:e3 ubiquitin-protein ligase TTC3 [Nephila pilipes]